MLFAEVIGADHSMARLAMEIVRALKGWLYIRRTRSGALKASENVVDGFLRISTKLLKCACRPRSHRG